MSELPLFAEESDPDEEDAEDDGSSTTSANAASPSSPPSFCAVCFRELGSLQYQLLARSQDATAVLDPNDPFLEAALPLLSSKSECEISGGVLTTSMDSGGCAFCSQKCLLKAEEQWRYFAALDLKRYKTKVLEQTDNATFVFAAKVIGGLLASLSLGSVTQSTAVSGKEAAVEAGPTTTSPLIEKFERFCHKPYHEIVPFKVDESESGDEEDSDDVGSEEEDLTEEGFRFSVRADLEVAHSLISTRSG